MSDPMPSVEEIAEWSPWVPVEETLKTAPRLYMAREGADGPLVYVGMAGERVGGGRPRASGAGSAST